MSLLTLPVPISARIHAHIDNLVDHVNLALSSKVLWQRYLESGFFGKACDSLGYGLPNKSHRNGKVCPSYAALAVALSRIPLLQQRDETPHGSKKVKISSTKVWPPLLIETAQIQAAPPRQRPILLIARAGIQLLRGWSDSEGLLWMNMDSIGEYDISGDCIVLFYTSSHDRTPVAIKFAGSACLWKHRSHFVDYALVESWPADDPDGDIFMTAAGKHFAVTVGEVIARKDLWGDSTTQRIRRGFGEHGEIWFRSI